MAGIAGAIATSLIGESEAERISSDDVDGELQTDESDKVYNGQAAVWVFFEYLHTTTASEWWFDKVGEFFLLINNVRFPSKGTIFMEKDTQFTVPRPRAIYTEFMKIDAAKCELNIEVREQDLIRDDRLLKMKLSQPFLPGTYRKVISIQGTPIILSLILKLEKNIFCTRQKIAKPLLIGRTSKSTEMFRKKPTDLSKSASVINAIKDVSDEPDPDVPPAASPRK